MSRTGETSEAILEGGNVEVEKQTDWLVAQFEVGDELCCVDVRKGVHGLDFNDHRVFTKNVESIADVDSNAIVDDR